MQDGGFREDLWYRIAVFPIVLPPLRERREDIPRLAKHFTKKASLRFGLKIQTPSPEDISLLASYDWPGNIREFGSVIDRAVILGDGERLEVAKALGVNTNVAAPFKSNYTRMTSMESHGATAILTLDELMKRHIEIVLAATHGRIEGIRGAAALLKINPHTLRARMRKLGINWAAYRSKP